MLHHVSVGTSLKQNKRNLKKPNPNPNLIKGIITFIVFHNKIYVLIIIFTAFSFLLLIHGYLLSEEIMSVRLSDLRIILHFKH